ncbi:MAG TPA: hypothetical protein VK611_07805 [Acidimicrobiales bacterium]|nr:hypothetical protein [Acidimicrobiales bacterium]
MSSQERQRFYETSRVVVSAEEDLVGPGKPALADEALDDDLDHDPGEEGEGGDGDQQTDGTQTTLHRLRVEQPTQDENGDEHTHRDDDDDHNQSALPRV